MKRLIVFGSICALLLLASCSPGEGTIASCTSGYVGTFEGATDTGVEVSGAMIGQLDGNGKLLTYISPNSGGNFAGEGQVDENGDVTSVGRFVESGTFDFEDCKASGTWVFGALGEGTWRLELPDTAL